MKEFLRQLYYKIISLLPDKLVINIENLMAYKKLVSKENPKYFGEKIQWLKMYGNLEKYNDYVDKYKVREYIKQKVGEEYLIPILGVYDTPDEIDYSKLPNQFVLKLNTGSGFNIIVKNKEELDIEKTNKQLEKWLKIDYSKIKKEYQYKNVKKRIICEKYVVDKNNQLLDYKYFCFDGKPEFIKVDFDRFKNHTANFYDLNWNLLDIKEKCFMETYENYAKDFIVPKNHEKMLDIVNSLCKDFQFIRVDIYNVDGKIYFGELTFTPASGRHPFVPLEKDLEIARRIKVGE